MMIIIGFTILCLVGFILMLRKAIREGKKPLDGTHIDYTDMDEDEHSPENINLNSTLKILSLRKRLNKIEDERSPTKKEK